MFLGFYWPVLLSFGLDIYQLKEKQGCDLIFYINVENKKYWNNIKSHSYFIFNWLVC